MPKKIIPTAEEFLNDIRNITYSNEEKLIIFAKLHVEKALKEASEKATIKYDHFDDMASYINKSSILNSYPLSNIK